MITMSDCNSSHIHIVNLHISFYSFIILFINISNTVAENIKRRGATVATSMKREIISQLYGYRMTINPSLDNLSRFGFGGVLNVFNALVIHAPD